MEDFDTEDVVGAPKKDVSQLESSGRAHGSFTHHDMERSLPEEGKINNQASLPSPSTMLAAQTTLSKLPKEDVYALLEDPTLSDEGKVKMVVNLLTPSVLHAGGSRCPLCNEGSTHPLTHPPPPYSANDPTVELDMSNSVDMGELDRLPALAPACKPCEEYVKSACDKVKGDILKQVGAKLEALKENYQHQLDAQSSNSNSISAAFPSLSGQTLQKHSKKHFHPPPMDRKYQHADAIRIYLKAALGSENPEDSAFALEQANLDQLKRLPAKQQDAIAAFMKQGGYTMDQIYMERFHPDLSIDPVRNKQMAQNCPWVWMVSTWPEVPELTKVRDPNYTSTILGGQVVKLRPVLVTVIEDSYGMKHESFTWNGQGPKDHVKADQYDFYAPLREWSSHPVDQPQPVDALMVIDRDVPEGAHLSLIPERFSWSSPMAPFRSGGLTPFSQVILNQMVTDVQEKQSKLMTKQIASSHGVNDSIMDDARRQVAKARASTMEEGLFWSNQSVVQQPVTPAAKPGSQPRSPTHDMDKHDYRQHVHYGPQSAEQHRPEALHKGNINQARRRLMEDSAALSMSAHGNAGAMGRCGATVTPGFETKSKGPVTLTTEQLHDTALGLSVARTADGAQEGNKHFRMSGEILKRQAEGSIDEKTSKRVKTNE